MQEHCKCSISLQHVADGRLLCDSSHPNWVVFTSIVIGSKISGVTSTELVSSIQRWTATKPTVTTKGVQLEILSNCSVFLASGSTPSCVPVNSTPTEPIPSKTEETVPVTTSGIPAIVDTEQQSGSGNTVMFISVAGAGVVLLIIIVVIIINIVVCKKRNKQNNVPAISTLKSVS